MMKALRLIALLPVLALVGCTTTKIQNWDKSLPLVSAEEVSIVENTPWINLSVQALEFENTATEVKAKSVEYKRAGRASSATIVLKVYKRVKTKPETSKALEKK